MKVQFKTADRLALALYAILGAFLSVVLGSVALLRDRVALSLGSWSFRPSGSVLSMLLTLLAALILFVWSCCLVTLAFRHTPKQDKTSVAVGDSENGSVRVAIAAIETLVKQAVGHVEGVEQMHTAVENNGDSISVNLDMTLHGDAHIPDVTSGMQKSIRKFIEGYSGVAVRDVTVMVSSIVEPVAGDIPEEDIPAEEIPVAEIAAAENPPAEEEIPIEEPPAQEAPAPDEKQGA